ncbi:corticosteroid-binding globulin-like [Protopterus annectens]|uniref:corticosteroid-binding globulin-like n=1 Tax=Protopterus annectens TaxID=7888 RepID=UPI001CFC255D|nr:corticosteroid-binding globulin-like [Protopterus annectens]
MKIASLLFFSLIPYTASCSYHSTNVGSHGNTADNEMNSQHEMCKQLMISNQHFAIYLYKHVASQSTETFKNIIISPFAIGTSFAMLSLGTRSSTKDQIQRVLGFEDTMLSEYDVHHCFTRLLQIIKSNEEEVYVGMETAVFLQSGISFLPNFLNDIRHYYNTHAVYVDFSNTYHAKNQINNFIRQESLGKMVDVVQEINQHTMLLLINYISFKAKWMEPFVSTANEDRHFFVSEHTAVKVPLMQRAGEISTFYDDILAAVVVKLPYYKGFSVLLILPNKWDIKTVEDALSQSTLANWKQQLTLRYVALQLPKFSLSASYEMKDVLERMGMTDLFSNEADFSGIGSDPNLQISKILHAAALEVNEQGTEAQASTTVEIEDLALPQSIVFNRPFLLVIYKHDTETILFMGKVMNPAEY